MREERNVEYEFSLGARWTHWIRVICIIALTFTGFYLAYGFIAVKPANEPTLFLYAKFRFWHEIIGFALIAVTIYKIYLFALDKEAKSERVAFFDVLNPKVWIEQIKFYLFMGKHPKLKGAYNPLQFVAYVGLYVLVFIVCLSGVILYVHNYNNGLGGFLYSLVKPLEVMLGGLSNVRYIHHLATWGILIFVPIHIYMAVFNSIMNKEGAVDSIVSGYKFEKISKS